MRVALASPTTAYANENRNTLEELFFGSASLDRHRLNATPMSYRHDFVFAAPHPNHEGFTRQYF
jgi:hypothetical protein